MKSLLIPTLTLLAFTTVNAETDKEILDVLYNDFNRCDHYLIDEKPNLKTLDDEGRALRLRRQCLMHFKYIDSVSLLAMGSNSSVNKIQSQAILALEDNSENSQAHSAKEKFKNNNFGYGFAVINYKEKIIDKASVVNGVLVAESEKNNEAKLILEYHALLKSNNNWEKSGHGIMLAAMLGENDLIDGFGFGYVYSLKSGNKLDGSGISIGFGLMLENDVKQLANGFEIGKALPTGETIPRFVEKDETSPFLFFTSTF